MFRLDQNPYVERIIEFAFSRVIKEGYQPSSPQINQINRTEDEWLHLKRHELASQVFEDEYELALAIINGITARAKRGNYQVERFMFN